MPDVPTPAKVPHRHARLLHQERGDVNRMSDRKLCAHLLGDVLHHFPVAGQPRDVAGAIVDRLLSLYS
jgi:hypothetical protein